MDNYNAEFEAQLQKETRLSALIAENLGRVKCYASDGNGILRRWNKSHKLDKTEADLRALGGLNPNPSNESVYI